MAKGKYSDRMTQLGCIRPQKGMTYGFPPKHRPEITTYHHIEGLFLYNTCSKISQVTTYA